MSRKRKRDCAGGRGRVVERLIQLKVKFNFSVRQLKEIISLYEPKETELIGKAVIKELRQKYSAFRLHGCSQCDDYIWISAENQDGRFVCSFFCYCLLTHDTHVDILAPASKRSNLLLTVVPS